MHSKLGWIFCLCLPLIWACEGPVGPQGDPGIAGEAGANGEAGVHCYAGLEDQNGDGVVDEKDCLGKKGADGKDSQNAPLELSEEQVKEIESRQGVAECVGCQYLRRAGCILRAAASG